MSHLSESLWDRLKIEGIRGPTLWARRSPFDPSERIIAALDAAERRHWLIRIDGGDQEISDLKSRGIAARTQELEGIGRPLGRYIDVTCLDSAGHEAFDLIGEELAARITLGKETETECVSRVLAKWRRFWEHRPSSILPLNAQLGLFAELWFLVCWLIPKRGVTAIRDWRGPFGSRHDFERIGRSIEVKGTLSEDGHHHHVNGLDQLDLPETGDLLFFSLHLRQEQGASNNLPAVVQKCRGLLREELELSDQFEAALSTSGYSETDRDVYSDLRLRVAGERLYVVSDTFPRLTRLNLLNGLPMGISRIEYDIDLSGFDHLCIAKRPDDVAIL